MRKIYILIIAILMITMVFLIADMISLNNRTILEIEKIEKILELKKEINLEYSYLFDKTSSQNIDEQIKEKNAILLENENKINSLQEEVNILKDKNEELESLKEELKEEILEREIEIERRKKENEEKSTVKIDREITYSQFPEYPTGCESIALYILLRYYDVDVIPSEIVSRLRKGQLPYQIGDKLYGGNPELEFIGDPRNDYSYGVFNTPIAEVANSFKENVYNKEGLELDEIFEIVSEGRPVIVWTTIGNVSSKVSSIWTYRKTGDIVYWKENEHAVVVIGYNNDYVIVSDPYTGEIEKYNKGRFRENYNYLGKRAVYY